MTLGFQLKKKTNWQFPLSSSALRTKQLRYERRIGTKLLREQQSAGKREVSDETGNFGWDESCERARPKFRSIKVERWPKLQITKPLENKVELGYHQFQADEMQKKAEKLEQKKETWLKLNDSTV